MSKQKSKNHISSTAEIASRWGAGRAVVLGFKPQKYELYVLLKDCYREAVDTEFYWYISDSFGGSESGERAHANERFNAISKLLGTEVTKRAVAEVDAEFRKEHPYQWRAFRGGIVLKRTPDGIPLPENQQPPLWTPKAKRKAA